MESLFKFIQLRPAVKSEASAPIHLSPQELFGPAPISKASPIQARLEAYAQGPAFISDPQDLEIFDTIQSLSQLFDAWQQRPHWGRKDLHEAAKEILKTGLALAKETLQEAADRLKKSILTILFLPEYHGLPVEALTNLLRDIETLAKLKQAPNFPSAKEPLADYRNRPLAMDQSLDSSPKPPSTPQQVEEKEEAGISVPTPGLGSVLDTLRGQSDWDMPLAKLPGLDLKTLEHLFIPDPSFLPDPPELPKGSVGLDPKKLTVRQAIQELETQQANPVEPRQGVPDPEYTFRQVGSKVILIRDAPKEEMGRHKSGLPASARPFDAGIAPLHRPYTVVLGDLLVVKQQLIRYQGADIAHIENILKGEKKEKEHVYKQEKEELFFEEAETSEATEDEIASTQRHELSEETKKTAQEAASFKGSLGLKGDLGPFVEFNASAEYATSSEDTRSETQGANYAREVVQKSVEKLTSRTLKRATRRFKSEVSEKNLHAIDNTQGEDHTAGMYQWVNKVYQNQVYNYGQRVLFDFIIPEPAAYLIESLINNPDPSQVITKPARLFHYPHLLTEDNYMIEAGLLGVANLPTPPVTYTTLSHHFTLGGGQEQPGSAAYKSLKIPDGYRAISATITVLEAQKNLTSTILINVGSQVFKYTGERGFFNLLLDQNQETGGGQAAETPSPQPTPPPSSVDGDGRDMDESKIDEPKFVSPGSLNKIGTHAILLPLSKETQEVSLHPAVTGELSLSPLSPIQPNVVVSITVKCQVSDEHMEEWRLKTFDIFEKAYEDKMRVYEAKLEELEIETHQTANKNASQNEALVLDELKKHCITLLTQKHLEGFDGIREQAGNPLLDLDKIESQGQYVKFMEQAFEWSLLQYIPYPYFWSRKRTWNYRIRYEGNDPVFGNFIKAGYCRVVVPVRIGFEKPLQYFQHFGQLWEGGALPVLGDDQYLPIAQEIASMRNQPMNEVPVGPVWFEELPTTLVRLRPGNDLPAWEQNEAGDWVVVDQPGI
ncbi:MAG: hypothetical protein AAFQ98_01100 [Bacteroidota bacterium]